ncbi:hypothetical protein HD554DRAFT_2126597 [Boletus coccyginus]|nr:hypothetical protein HD554DRAFT_2126597 [Boletus coccyginus]
MEYDGSRHPRHTICVRDNALEDVAVPWSRDSRSRTLSPVHQNEISHRSKGHLWQDHSNRREFPSTPSLPHEGTGFQRIISWRTKVLTLVIIVVGRLRFVEVWWCRLTPREVCWTFQVVNQTFWTGKRVLRPLNCGSRPGQGYPDLGLASSILTNESSPTSHFAVSGTNPAEKCLPWESGTRGRFPKSL